MRFLEPLLGVLVCATVGVAVFSGGAFGATSLFVLRCLVLLGLLLFALGWAFGVFRFSPRVMLAALGIYVLLALLSTVRSPYPYSSLQSWLNLLVYAGAFMMAAVLSAQDRRIVVWVLCGCAVVLGFYGLVQWVEMEAGLGQVRLSGFYYNSNHYSGLLTLLIPVVIGMAWATQGLTRILLGLLVLVLVFNLSQTFAWGLVFVLLVLLVWWRKRWLWMLGLGLAGFLLILLSPQLGSGNLKQRFDELVFHWTGNSLTSRVHLANASKQIITEHPWIGVGPGNYGYAFNPYRPPLIRSEAHEILHRRVEYAHNDYLQVASETGLPSLLAFVIFWGLVVWVRLPRPSLWSQETLIYTGIRAGLIALLLHGLSDGNLTHVPANALLAYLLAGLLVGAAKTPVLEDSAAVLQGEMVWQDQQVTEVRDRGQRSEDSEKSRYKV